MAADPRDLTTIANVKAAMPGTPGGSGDTLLQRYVTACSAFFQRACERDFIRQSYTEVRDGNGRDRIPLAHWPVQPSPAPVVTLDGIAIPARASLSDGGFVLSLPVGGQYFDGQAVLVRDGARWTRGTQNLTVVYTAGYLGPSPGPSSVPQDLEEAVIETVVLRFRERERQGDASKSLNVGGSTETVTFLAKDLTPFAESVVEKYRRVLWP